ncbi:hypothetical protein JAAARDRAFT_62281 [Jaapia argillacea MUCL 33604]|uniref:Uncharacterized protein n=1 Tax=Jaapia argillacea MUCL 33604 TaxID=933084 RepID=A0A067PL33_9AGAM|nr:hypothetical protein JAAARDRAFT_62281 [Jaapia argillacea MUCL 33604]
MSEYLSDESIEWFRDGSKIESHLEVVSLSTVQCRYPPGNSENLKERRRKIS